MIPARAVLGVSGAVTLWAAVPYLRDTWRGRTRPRLSSWLIWALAMGVGAAAALGRGQVIPGLFTGLCAAECGAVAVLGFARGDRAFGRLDACCAAGGLAGLVLLAAGRAPAQAVAVSVAVDLAAYTPTIRHAWTDPGEETWSTFAWYGLASALILAVTDRGSFTAAAYPAYLAVFDTSAGVLILARRAYRGRNWYAARADARRWWRPGML